GMSIISGPIAAASGSGDDPHFRFQLDAVRVEHGLPHELDEAEDVLEGGVVLVHHEVGVHGADLRAAQAGALEPAGLDEAAGVVALGILEHAAAAMALRLLLFTALDVVLVDA